MKHKIKSVLIKVANMLNISMPKIIYDMDNSFYTDGVIHLKIYDDFNKTLFIALHELRHHYQFLYRKNIKDNMSKIINYEINHDIEYNLSYMEGDAYTFSLYIFENILNISYDVSIQTKEIIHIFKSNFSFVFSIFSRQ